MAYDLFGDGRTAIKGNYSKYLAPWTGNFALFYANAVQSERLAVNWYDADLIPGTSTRSGAALPTNSDDIAQDNEIGPSSSTTFGVRSDRNPADGIQNFYNWETTASVQHQLMTGVSVTAAYYHRTYTDLHITDRPQITNADYTSFTTKMPDFSNDPTLDGVLDPNEILTIYNLNPAKRSVYSASQIDYNSTGAVRTASADTSMYNGFEISFSARLPKGHAVRRDRRPSRTSQRFCDTNDNPNGVTTSDLYSGRHACRAAGASATSAQFDDAVPAGVQAVGQLPAAVRRGLRGRVCRAIPGSAADDHVAAAGQPVPGGPDQRARRSC